MTPTTRETDDLVLIPSCLDYAAPRFRCELSAIFPTLAALIIVTVEREYATL